MDVLHHTPDTTALIVRPVLANPGQPDRAALIDRAAGGKKGYLAAARGRVEAALALLEAAATTTPVS